jgi:hypothetical protein
MLILQKISNRLNHYLGQSLPGFRKWRPQWLPPSAVLKLESTVHPHHPAERADCFLAYNGYTTEMEVLNWLYATILLFKPNNIVETGAADGLGTIALASACKANGFGCVHSVELDKRVCVKAEERIKRAGLSAWTQYHCEDSLEFLRTTSTEFDLAFFDSFCQIRAEECRICMERGILHGPAVFHDTSPYRTLTLPDSPPEPLHSEFRRAIKELSAQYFENKSWESTLSRGLTILIPKSVDPTL